MEITKSISKLKDQVALANETVGFDLAPSALGEEVYSKNIKELRAKYKERLELYTKILRAAKRHDFSSKITQELKSQIELVQAFNRLDTYINNHLEDETARTLVEDQFFCLQKLRDYIEAGGKAGYFKLPTGYGKTVLFTEFIEAMNVPTLVVVPTLDLMTQTEEKFDEFADILDVGFVYGRAKQYGNKVTVITYDSLIIGINNGSIKPEDYGCLIMDEAHLALHDEAKKTVNQFGNIIKIGFTATPKYGENKKLSDLLPDEIHSVRLPNAIEDGRLCSMRAIIAKTNFNLQGVKIDKNGTYDEKELEKAINIEARNKSALQLYQQLFDGEKGFVNCLNVAHAQDVAKLFNDAEIPAKALVGTLSLKERKDIKADFAAGKIKVLTGDRLLIVGLDEPSATFCINLNPTESQVDAEQRGGRVARLFKGNPNKIGTVVDVIDEDTRGQDKKIKIKHSHHRDIEFRGITFAEILGNGEIVSNVSKSTGKTKIKQKLPPLPPIKIEGLQVITDPEEVMRVVNNQNKQNREILKGGWLTGRAMARNLKISLYDVIEMSKPYQTSNPEWFLRERMGEMYFSPSLIPPLEEDKLKLTAPEDWRRDKQVYSEFNVNDGDVNLLYQIDEECKSEWVKNFIFPRKGKYYHPTLIEKIKNRPKDVIPKGYMSSEELAKALKTTPKSVIQAVESVSKNTQWQLNEEGSLVSVPRKKGDTHPLLCFKTTLAEKIKSHIIKRDSRFLAVEKIAEDLGTSIHELLSFILEQNLLSKTIKFQDETGEHMAVFQDDIFSLKEEYVKVAKWPTYEALLLELNIQASYLDKIIKSKTSSPEQIFYLRNIQKSILTKYIRLDLVAQIKAEIMESAHPENWVNENEIILRTGLHPGSLKKIFQLIKIADIDKGVFRNEGGNKVSYYSAKIFDFVLCICAEIKKWPKSEEFADMAGGNVPRTEALVLNLGKEAGEVLFFAIINNTKYFNPTIVDLVKNKLEEIKLWTNLESFRKTIRLEPMYFDFLLARLQEADPNGVKFGLDECGRRANLISPSLKVAIENEVEQIKEWKMTANFASELGITLSSLKKIIEYYRNSFRFVTVQFKRNNYIESEHVHPEFVETIKNLIIIPEKYKNLRKLAASVNVNPKDLAERITKLEDNLRAKIKLCWDNLSFEVTEFGEAEVVAALNLISVSEIPADFFDEEQIIAEIIAEFGEGYNFESVKGEIRDNIAELKRSYMADKAMVFRKVDMGQEKFYYSRSFIHKFKTDRLPAPNGWITLEDLKEGYDEPQKKVTIVKLYKKFSEGKNEYTKEYYDNLGKRKNIYLSPELTDQIRYEIE